MPPYIQFFLISHLNFSGFCFQQLIHVTLFLAKLHALSDQISLHKDMLFNKFTFLSASQKTKLIQLFPHSVFHRPQVAFAAHLYALQNSCDHDSIIHLIKATFGS